LARQRVGCMVVLACMKEVVQGSKESAKPVAVHTELIGGYAVFGDGMTDGLPRPVRGLNPNEGISAGYERIPVGHIALKAEALARHEDSQD